MLLLISIAYGLLQLLFGFSSSIQLNHYWSLSKEDCYRKRPSSHCHGKHGAFPHSGIHKFLPALRDLRSRGWDNRPEFKGLDGVHCVVGYEGALRSTCRSHFLTALVCINEDDKHLAEWLDFQRLVGFDHVLLYDVASKNSTNEIARPYVAAGFVTYFSVSHIREECNRQHNLSGVLSVKVCVCWQNVVLGSVPFEYQKTNATFWMAMFDVDEFFYPIFGASLKPELLRFTEFRSLYPGNLPSAIYKTATIFGWGSRVSTLTEHENVIETFNLTLTKMSLKIGKSIVLLDYLRSGVGLPHTWGVDGETVGNHFVFGPFLVSSSGFRVLWKVVDLPMTIGLDPQQVYLIVAVLCVPFVLLFLRSEKGSCVGFGGCAK